jgi:hypothetical protein
MSRNVAISLREMKACEERTLERRTTPALLSAEREGDFDWGESATAGEFL